MDVEPPTLNPVYDNALGFLYGFIDYERSSRWKYDDEHFDLGRVKRLLADLGDPHRRGRFVHIAGTNGKGSVAAFVANTLVRAGYRTGLYTSPHLLTFRERIRIDGVMMSREDVVEGVERIRDAVGRYAGSTFFEVWTALAFDFFARRSADVSVIEAGMGGRLDTTNVVVPDVSVITPVSMDHIGILGDTLAVIAREKAGIVKPGVPVVSAPQVPEALDVIRDISSGKGSGLTVTGTDTRFGIRDGRLWYEGIGWRLDDIAVPLQGMMQFENAATALTVLETLADAGYRIDSGTAKKGVETVRWPGRLHRVASKPEVLVDGACNSAAMEEVCRYVSGQSPRERTVAVIALCRDKEAGKLLSLASACAARLVLTCVDNPRAMAPGELAALVSTDTAVTVEPTVEKAMREAVLLAGKDGLVIAAGSLYLVGEVLRLYGFESFDRI